MAFIPVENTVRVVMTFNDSAGNEAVNVLHFSADEVAPTVALMNDLLDAIEGWLTAWWDTVASNQWTATRLEALDLTTENSWYVSRTISVQGTTLNSALPPQDTVAVSLRSNFSGRSRRGRLFHVGTDEAAQDGGYITQAYADSLITVYENLMVAATGVNWTWVVVSYVADGVPRTNGQTTTIQYIIITDLIIDSMDKRKPKA